MGYQVSRPAARQFKPDSHPMWVSQRVIIRDSRNTAEVREAHDNLTGQSLQMRRLGKFSRMNVGRKPSFENNAFGKDSATMVISKRAMHRFDQLGRSMNGIGGLWA